MPDPPFDVAVANRFISSLSKSLQALCHGCMDFNSGIEIVGYINVNIDCGSKADYVLNEKVLKSTTNSMTFVSNSFLAKKDQPKQTRDGACSPIPQLGAQFHGAPYQHRTRGYSHSSFNRSAHFNVHSFRGAQKRGFVGEWRGSAKRHRPIPGDMSSSAQIPPTMSAQGVHNQKFSYSHQQSDPNSTNTGVDGENSMVNIKKETIEAGEETQTGVGSSDQQAEGASSELDTSGVNIKSDPDGATPDGEANTNSAAETSDNNDFKGTFLHPASEDTQNSNTETQLPEGSDQLALSDQHVGFETPFPNPQSPSAVGENQSSNSAHTQPKSVSNTELGSDSEGAGANSNTPIEYDNAAEETSYSEYPDAGEGTSSGQFEVIEIDDEDEDMQAMFGASRNSSERLTPVPSTSSQNNQSTIARVVLDHNRQGFARAQESNSPSVPPSGTQSSFSCPVCFIDLANPSAYQKHINALHRGAGLLPFSCTLCHRGFYSHSGLKYHEQTHGAQEFVCFVCSAKHKHKVNLRRHLERAHRLKECRYCESYFNQGAEFERHIVSCDRK